MRACDSWHDLAYQTLVIVTVRICYIFELGPSKRIFRDSNPDLRCVTITLNTRGSIANRWEPAVWLLHDQEDRFKQHVNGRHGNSSSRSFICFICQIPLKSRQALDNQFITSICN